MVDEPLFNTPFADSRGISQEDQYAMQRIYEFLYEILDRPEKHCETPRQAVELVRGLEYTLQLFWKFPIQKSFHSYWHSLKGCTCPEMDNLDRVGSGGIVVTDNCPYHCSDRLAETWKDGRFE